MGYNLCVQHHKNNFMYTSCLIIHIFFLKNMCMSLYIKLIYQSQKYQAQVVFDDMLESDRTCRGTLSARRSKRLPIAKLLMPSASQPWLATISSERLTVSLVKAEEPKITRMVSKALVKSKMKPVLSKRARMSSSAVKIQTKMVS